MEREYLYNYLLYQKEHNKSSWKKLIRLPWYILLLLTVSFVLLITTFILYCFLSNKLPVIILEIAAMIVIFTTCFLSEKHQVSTSKSTLQNYAESRANLNGWLKTVHINSDEDKKLLLSRLKEYISSQESNMKMSADRWDKWLQVLVIPVVLSLITTIIANQKDVSMIIVSVMTIMFIFGMLYGLFFLLKTLSDIPINRKLNQMRYFAKDLQSTMDMEQLGWITPLENILNEDN